MSNSKKGGRPEIETKRDKKKLLYFTNEEFQSVENLFSESDYNSINEMIRDILLNNKYKIIATNREERIQRTVILEQVKRIGNNFNQLIKSLNQRKMDSLSSNDIAVLHKNIIEIKNVYIEINNVISNQTYK